MEIDERIIAAAGALFMKYGTRSVTMDDIARELSVSKKTIYQYYKDKDEIVTLASAMQIEQDKKEFDEVFETSGSAIEEMVKISQCLRKMVREINPSLLYDLQKYHKKAWDLYLDYKTSYIKNSVASNLKRGIEEGYYRNDINPEIMAAYRVEQVQMAFDDKIFSRSEFDFKEVHMQLFDHFLHGLLTDKGRKLHQAHQLKNGNQ